MNELYPLKFKPIFKEKIWGGKKISQVLKQNFSPLPNCGELWALSGMGEAASLVSNGFLKGNSLNELVEVYMGDLIGDVIYDKYEGEFPLLFKYINSEDYLSVQVHPDDELAMTRHASFGKTEMWYVLDADEGAELISGLNRKMSREEFMRCLQNNNLKDQLQFYKVKAGDVFYIPSGTIHAIGAGILLAEIQQASDITYRLFDWDRFDQAGMKRELHTELALNAINFDKPNHIVSHPQMVKNKSVSLQISDFFTVNLLDLDDRMEKDFNDIDSFVVYMCFDGAMTFGYSGEPVKVNTGETLLVPAFIKDFSLIPEASCKLIETYIS